VAHGHLQGLFANHVLPLLLSLLLLLAAACLLLSSHQAGG